MLRLIISFMLLLSTYMVGGCDGRNDGSEYYDGSRGKVFRETEASMKNSQTPGSAFTPVF